MPEGNDVRLEGQTQPAAVAGPWRDQEQFHPTWAAVARSSGGDAAGAPCSTPTRPDGGHQTLEVYRLVMPREYGNRRPEHAWQNRDMPSPAKRISLPYNFKKKKGNRFWLTAFCEPSVNNRPTAFPVRWWLYVVITNDAIWRCIATSRKRLSD